MTDIDSILSAIENRTRREILSRLIHGEVYPLQLSRELGISQQAVMKHLYILEKTNIVRMRGIEKSEIGPNRKIYSLDESFILNIYLTPYFFDIRKREINNYDENIGNVDDPILMLKKIDEEIEELEERIAQKISIKKKILSIIDNEIIPRMDSDIEREIFSEYIKSWNEEYVAGVVGLPDNIVKQILKRIMDEYL
ncbi:MAG: helix-turn-helix domain-containing protein [Thermoplasmata archaeon]|jgi:ArsR family transcriptional regulator|nr:helix-turn-helix domain-containing protein [Euryarchaeota archaeon]MVT35337.1 helix-turn-helix domain-containing protein [Euryarchaeota archaeon]